MPVQKNVKDYFYYKPGSYWVMQDSVTGRIDSFAVVHSQSVIYSVPELSEEVITCGMRQFRLNTPGDADSVTLMLSHEFSVSLHFFSSDKFTYRYVVFNGFIPGDSIVGDVVISNITYKNVEVSYPYAYAIDSSNNVIHGSKFYVNKTEGLLKMILPQANQKYTWELLRSKVIR